MEHLCEDQSENNAATKFMHLLFETVGSVELMREVLEFIACKEPAISDVAGGSSFKSFRDGKFWSAL